MASESCGIAMSTKSEEYRESGNKMYRSALLDDHPAAMEEHLLRHALQFYMKAVRYSYTPDELSSAHKNAGQTAWKLALLLCRAGEEEVVFLEEDEDEEDDCGVPDLAEVLSLYEDAFNHFEKAESFGRFKPKQWRRGISKSKLQCLESFIHCVTNTTRGLVRASFIEKMLHELRHDEHKATCYIAIVESLYRESITMREDGDFRSALSLLHESHFPLEEAARLSRRRQDLQSQVDDLRCDIQINMSVAEAMQAFDTGDNVLEKAVDDEDINVDMVWEAIDWYRKGLICAREREIEMEAKAHSRLGKVYYYVLKNVDRARTHFRLCIQLALTMYPSSPEKEEWYKSAKTSLDKIQQNSQMEEEKTYQRSRACYLLKLKQELADLKSIQTELAADPEKLLRRVYKRFPPLNQNHCLLYKDSKTWTKEMCKKAFQKAVLHYHPDKVDVVSDGMKAKVLQEEITKLLTRFYTDTKDALAK